MSTPAELATRTSDTYAVTVGRCYSPAEWLRCCELLLARGYDPVTAEAILRSKIPRWASDSNPENGPGTAEDFARFIDNNPSEISELLAELKRTP